MSLLDQIQRDIKTITSNNSEFARSIVFTSPDLVSVSINALHTKIRLAVDTDGNVVSSKKSHISFSEESLTELSYPVRNGNNEVDLYGHIVEVSDSTGQQKKYIIREWFPDETIGLIVCILDDFYE